MRKRIKHIICISLISCTTFVYSQQRIVMFVREYPALKDNLDAEKFLQKMKDPQKAARKILKLSLRSYAKPGIFATYGGYITLSNNEGQITFPRKHQRPFIYLIITPDIKPVLMIGRTVHHWELLPNQPVVVYRVEFKQDEQTQLYYWDVQLDEPPGDNIVQLDSIIIVAKPKNVYIPTGITIKKQSPHLLLPDIYVKKGFNIITNSLNTLKSKHFFRQPAIEYKKAGDNYWSTQRTD